ncbi:MAG: Uma2 family endonuclease [Okeania sp. SIO3I5]|uniref:Uma2 family endonuclease n=1 Tax=Okeania sp. SIO3I5 TaxID=2607805 RepID=UPI0013BAAF79|nr:Uma2 family endonuclease [Okeania sp. SIO3I5]NEQ37252.1 Uma2 family endonuclease [Okeania sp. SIO3I5]
MTETKIPTELLQSFPDTQLPKSDSTTETNNQIDFPDHTQLPESDGTFVKNFQEHPQSIILTDSITPVLQRIHPDGQYAIGQDCGIYWRKTEPPEQGAVCPDWFYVPNVPPLLDGEYRRSYVLPREKVPPFIALELASGDGAEERDRTPLSQTSEGKKIKPGKFWVYEQRIQIPYYGIYEIISGRLEVYRLVNGRYQQMSPNERGHYPIEELGVELGLWEGNYENQYMLWLRWWDAEGNLLLTGKEGEKIQKVRAERAESQLERAESEAEIQKVRAERAESEVEMGLLVQRNAISRLLAMGLSLEEVSETLGLTVEKVQEILQ